MGDKQVSVEQGTPYLAHHPQLALPGGPGIGNSPEGPQSAFHFSLSAKGKNMEGVFDK